MTSWNSPFEYASVPKSSIKPSRMTRRASPITLSGMMRRTFLMSVLIRLPLYGADHPRQGDWKIAKIVIGGMIDIVIAAASTP